MIPRQALADLRSALTFSTNRRADDALIAEMQRFAQGEAFDERAMPALDSEAIDFRVASESFAPVRRLGRRDLETLRLVALVRAPEGLATREIASRIGRTPRATRTRLAALVALGLVRGIGTSPQDPKRRYFSTEAQ